jgi:hypothetical protein
MAAQDQAIRTNAIKAKTSSDSKCRLCKVKDETIDHLVSSCSKIAQTDYKERHNKVASMLQWNLCRKYNLPTADKWWEHKVDKVLQKEDVKILWDFKIQTDKHLAHNIPDITVVEKKQVWMIDVAIPGDSRIEEKELEKIIKYQDLKIQIERLWEKQATTSSNRIIRIFKEFFEITCCELLFKFFNNSVEFFLSTLEGVKKMVCECNFNRFHTTIV